jgi:hypothetical protein
MTINAEQVAVGLGYDRSAIRLRAFTQGMSARGTEPKVLKPPAGLPGIVPAAACDGHREVN